MVWQQSTMAGWQVAAPKAAAATAAVAGLGGSAATVACRCRWVGGVMQLKLARASRCTGGLGVTLGEVQLHGSVQLYRREHSWFAWCFPASA